jgi:hypothetical protein
MKTFLLLSILSGGLIETIVVPTESEQTCRFVEQQLLKAMELKIVDPAAPRIIAVECADEPPDDAVMAPPPEFPL